VNHVHLVHYIMLVQQFCSVQKWTGSNTLW